MDEIALIEKYKGGDFRAFSALMKQNQSYMEAAIIRVVNNRELLPDIMQEVLIRASRGLRNFKGACKLSSWLYKIALNEGYRYIKTRQNSPASVSVDELDDTLQDREPTAETLLVNAETGAILKECINDLPEEYRGVFISFYYDGLKLEDISSKHNLPQGTVNSRIARARDIVRDRYRKRHK